MTRRLRFTEAADADVANIAQHIAAETGRIVADKFVAQIVRKCERIAELPGTLGTAHPELGREIRTTPLKRYVILFRYGQGNVEIINILDGRRDITAYFGGINDDEPDA